MILIVLLYITFILFSLGQLGRASFFNQEVNLYLYEIFLIIGLILFVFRYRLKPIEYGVKKFKMLFAFLLLSLISYFLSLFSYSPFQNLAAFLYLLRLLVYLGFWGYLGYWVKKEKKIQKHLFFSLGIFVILTIASSLVQYLLYPDLRNLIYLGWDPHLKRLFGLFFDTSIAAAVYGLLFFYMLVGFKKLGLFGRLGLLGLFGEGLLLLAFVLTFSRSAYIAFAITTLLYVFQQKKVALLVVFFGLFIALFLVVPKQFGLGVGLERTFSISSRLADYKEAITIWSKHKVFGVGYNRIRYIRENIPIDSHAAASFSSSYLIILVTGGIIGLVFFVLTFLKLMMLNKHSQILFSFIGLLSFTDNILLHPFILFLVGVLTILLASPLSGKLPR